MGDGVRLMGDAPGAPWPTRPRRQNARPRRVAHLPRRAGSNRREGDARPLVVAVLALPQLVHDVLLGPIGDVVTARRCEPPVARERLPTHFADATLVAMVIATVQSR